MFRGSIPALVTPFRDEAFDEAVYRDFVEWQIGEGSHGLVPVGTTGESATLSAEEQRRAISVCAHQAKGRCRSSPAAAPTAPGSSSNI